MFILNASDFLAHNRFYRRQDCRQFVYRLYHRTCQGCRADLSQRDDYVSGHIIAQRHAELFEQLFPGLDVDNLLNLHLLCQPCNVRQSAYHFDSPFFLNQVFKESARAIQLRYTKVADELSTGFSSDGIEGALPQIPSYETVLHREAALYKTAGAVLKRSKSRVVPLDASECHAVWGLAKRALFSYYGHKLKAAEHFYPWIVLWQSDLEEQDGEFTESYKPIFDNLPGGEQQQMLGAFTSPWVCGVVRRSDLRELLRLAKVGLSAQIQAQQGGYPDYVDTAKSLTVERLREMCSASEPAWGSLFEKYLNSFVSLPSPYLLSSAEIDGDWCYWSQERLTDLLDALTDHWSCGTGQKASVLQRFRRLENSLCCSGIPYEYRLTEDQARSAGRSDTFDLVSLPPPNVPYLDARGRNGLWLLRSSVGDRSFRISTLSDQEYHALCIATEFLNQCYQMPDSSGRVIVAADLKDIVRAYSAKRPKVTLPNIILKKVPLRAYLNVDAFASCMLLLPEIMQLSSSEVSIRQNLTNTLPWPLFCSLKAKLAQPAS